MNSRLKISLVILVLLLAGSGFAAAAAGKSQWTTYNFHVDDPSFYACQNQGATCNSFLSKEHVWLNGAALTEDLRQDGDYFFAVLAPGGQQDPNDGGEKNLSDDYDSYLERVFTLSGGELSYAGLTHWLDSGETEGDGEEVIPNGLPPYIRLFPYADTTSPGGVYVLAVCSLEQGYPVDPRDCNYEAFMVREGRSHDAFVFSGFVFEDLYADGIRDDGDPGLKHWLVEVSGSGADGLPFSAEVRSDKDGYWEFETPLPALIEGQPPVTAEFTFCGVLEEGWSRSFPAGDGCHALSFALTEPGSILNLDFGNWYPVEVVACRQQGRRGSLQEAGEFVIALLQDGQTLDTRLAGEDGCASWNGLDPGRVYGVRAESGLEGFAPGELEWTFPRAKSGDLLSHTFMDMVEGCTPGFWQGGNETGSAGGKWLWNEDEDPEWFLSGGVGHNPFAWTMPFNEFFTPVEELSGLDMFALIDGGGGADHYQKAARDLVAGYLNAAWGMNYPYTTAQLAAMWAEAVASGDYLSLHAELDAANNAYQNGGNGHCPISAKHVGEIYLTFLPAVIR